MKRLILVAVLVCMVSPAWADKNNRYQSLGLGTKSCGLWTKERKIDGWGGVALAAWIDGFITSYNSFTSGVYDVTKGVDSYGRSAWVDNFCLRYPLETIAGAADNLIHHLKSR